MAVAGWVRRLFEGRGLAVPDRKLHWLGVHLDRFLGWCRKQGPPADLNALAGSYLRWQAQLHPPPPEWQLAQIRQGVARTRGNSRGALATSAGGSAVSP